jgi:hypothetical protein
MRRNDRTSEPRPDCSATVFRMSALLNYNRQCHKDCSKSYKKYCDSMQLLIVWDQRIMGCSRKDIGEGDKRAGRVGALGGPSGRPYGPELVVAIRATDAGIRNAALSDGKGARGSGRTHRPAAASVATSRERSRGAVSIHG